MRAKTTATLLILAILILGAFFRFYLITKIPPGLYPDEAMNGNNALEAISTGNFKIFYPENNGREGLFINLQAISLSFFGNEPWALRVVSALIGTLTILGIYWLTRELFQDKNSNLKALNSKQILNSNDINSKKFGFWIWDFGFSQSETIALLSSFFLASSFWHINFSRIGFRAIMIPFFATFGFYFLLKGLRKGKIFDLVYAGIFIGLGFYTYIAFRFMPFVLAVPIIWYLWRWLIGNRTSYHCIPCAIILFLFITFVVALPIGWYFLHNPGDFLGRGGQVSIFSAESPALEFIKSNIATLGMFFSRGDCNWRHNLACQPQLHPVVALFFLVGLILSISTLVRQEKNSKFQIPHSPPNEDFAKSDEQTQNSNNQNSKMAYYTLFTWMVFMSFPATLTREGLPHALRAIGMIPPVMIFAGLGTWWIAVKTKEWLAFQKEKWPSYTRQLSRIQWELLILFILLLLWIPFTTYKAYFIRWADNVNTRDAFSTDIYELGKYLNNLPADIQKYTVVNLSGVDIRGLPAPVQTVMFATDTFTEEKRKKKNITYITKNDWKEKIPPSPRVKTIISILNRDDLDLIRKLKIRYPNFYLKAPGNFIILQNF